MGGIVLGHVMLRRREWRSHGLLSMLDVLVLVLRVLGLRRLLRLTILQTYRREIERWQRHVLALR